MPPICGRNAWEGMEWNEHSLISISFLPPKLPNNRIVGISLEYSLYSVLFHSFFSFQTKCYIWRRSENSLQSAVCFCGVVWMTKLFSYGAFSCIPCQELVCSCAIQHFSYPFAFYHHAKTYSFCHDLRISSKSILLVLWL